MAACIPRRPAVCNRRLVSTRESNEDAKNAFQDRFRKPRNQATCNRMVNPTRKLKPTIRAPKPLIHKGLQAFGRVRFDFLRELLNVAHFF